MQNGEQIHAEMFASCTVMLFCIMNFNWITADCTVLQVTEFVLDFHAFLEERVILYNCIKVDFHNSMGTVSIISQILISFDDTSNCFVLRARKCLQMATCPWHLLMSPCHRSLSSQPVMAPSHNTLSMTPCHSTLYIVI